MQETVRPVSAPRQIGAPVLSTRIVMGLALAIVSAVMLILAFPPYNVWPLIFVAYVPFVLADHRVLPLRLAGLGNAVGIGLWLWVYLSMIFGSMTETWITQAIIVLVVVMSFTAGRGQRVFHERTGYRWFVLGGVLDTVGFEMVRSFIPMLATHAFVGHALHTQPWLIQPVSIFSIYGLDALVVVVNYALVQVAFVLFDSRYRWNEAPSLGAGLRRRWLQGTAVVLAAWICLSLILLAQAPGTPPVVRVAAVQHGYVTPGHMDPDTQEARLRQLGARTREAASKGAKLVIWPELGVGFDPQVEHTAELRALTKETGVYLLIGYGVVNDKAGWRNEAVMLTPAGAFLDVYGKNYPAGEPRIVTSGVYRVYETPLGRLAPIICNDANYTAPARISARLGAQLIMVPLRLFAGVYKEAPVHAVFRAVENRVSTVMVDGAYLSCMVDPYGRFVASKTTPASGPLTLVADVPLGASNALCTRLGDWVGWLSLAGYVAFSVFMEVTKRRKEVS